MCNNLGKMCTISVKGVCFLARSNFFGFLLTDHSGGPEDPANQI